ncbi:MAG: class I SAM-dependent methyltransferase [Actinobacteria bacterium]|nr:class I SAM-dependent methyltransferase [Actinomycetota bacterium]
MTEADRPAPGPTLDWGTGSYETTAVELEPVARRVVEMANLASGERVLDLACGTGNAALLAAKAGASVTGLDASERLVSVAAERGAAEHVHVRWQTGDLHALPFPDGSFELVISVFGVIFAQNPEQAISEIVRVLAPGGRALVTTWIPAGGIDAAVGIAMRAVSAATGFTPPRFPWADQAAVSALVARSGAGASFAEGQLTFTGTSPERYFDEVQSVHPMSVATRPLLENAGVYADVREQMIAALASHNEDPSGLRLTSRYLVVQIQRAAD